MGGWGKQGRACLVGCLTLVGLLASTPIVAQQVDPPIGRVDCNDAVSVTELSAAYLPVPNPVQTSSTIWNSASYYCGTVGTLTLPSGAAASVSDIALLQYMVDRGLASWQQEKSTTFTVGLGPTVYLIGREQEQEIFIPSGVTDYNTHSIISNFVLVELDTETAASSAMLGSLHSAVPFALFDDNALFIRQLMARGTSTGDILLSPEPIAFARETFAAAVSAVTELAGKPTGPDINAWFAALPHVSHVDGDPASFGYSAGGILFTAGVDGHSGAVRYGLAGSLEATGVQQDQTGDNAKIGTLRVGAYAAVDVDLWTLTGGTALGLHHIDTARFAALASPTSATYGAATLSTALDATGHYSMGDVLLEPMAGVVFSAIALESFTETGTLAIAGDQSLGAALDLYVGGRVSRELLLSDGRIIRPELHARVDYLALGSPAPLEASLIDFPSEAPFTLSALSPSPWAATIGASVGLDVGPGLTANIASDLTIREGALGGSLSMAAKGQF